MQVITLNMNSNFSFSLCNVDQNAVYNNTEADQEIKYTPNR